MKVALNKLNGGEVSPLMEGRIDLPSLSSSCRLMRNFMPLATGAAVRRPSMLFVSTPPHCTRHTKLIPFVYDVDTIYVIAFDYSTITVFRADGTVADEVQINGSPTPITAAAPSPTLGSVSSPVYNVDAITYAQVNDLLFICHPSMWPLLIERRADSDWRVRRWFDSPGFWFNDTTPDDKHGFGKSFWPAVLDEQVTRFDASDISESYLIQRTFLANGSCVIGGMSDASMSSIVDGPCPGFWRLYTGTTAFVGTIVIQGGDAWNATTWRTLYTITNASTGAMTLRQEWFQSFPFMKIVATRTSGIATIELRHVGSAAAPSVWMTYDAFPSVGIRLKSSPPAFATWEAGEWVQLGYLKSKQVVDVTVLATTADEFKTSAEMYVLGNWEFATVGIWQGDCYVEAKQSTGAWQTIRHLSSNKDVNHSVAGISRGETMRVRVSKYDAAAASGAAVPRFWLTAVDGTTSQYLMVTAKLDSAAVYVQGMAGFDIALAGQATTSVYRSAFSTAQGWPAAVCIHDQRLYFAGTSKRPTTIWASAVNDLYNFRRTGLDDGGFMFELASNEGNPVQWMLTASRGIILGTSGDEWLLDGGTTGITPTNITANRQSRIGSASIQALPAAGSTIFIQRGGFHVQEYQFAWESQQFQAVDLSELIKHLTLSGVRCLAYSQNPESMIWAVMNDGSLLTCSYHRQQEVIAWAKHTTTSGLIESVCVTHGSTGNADDVWFTVLRFGVRYLEKIDVSFWNSLYASGSLAGGFLAPGFLYHADCATVKLSNTAFTSVTGLSRFNGQAVSILANGTEVTEADGSAVVVSGGSVTVPAGTKRAVVGLGYVSTLQPMPFELPLMTGTVMGRKTHEPTVAIKLWRTAAAFYSDGNDGTSYLMKLPNTNYTGLMRLAAMGKMRDSNEVKFESVGTLPLNIIAVVPSLNVYGE